MTQLSFWLTNISKRNISLADLNLTIKALSSINLLDTKHYNYTLNQLEKSAESGSIFKKKFMLAIRKVAPEIIKMNIPLKEETYIPSRERSTLIIKEEVYQELNVIDDQKLSDEQFAKENADIAELDNQKGIISRR